MKQEFLTQDLIIIGSGIMGLMTAYHASSYTKNILVLERSTIGNTEAASFSFTRSIRTDYLEPAYARLAYEAQGLWLELQQKSAESLFINCGCLNIAKKSVTPDLTRTYAERSYQVLNSLTYQPEKFDREGLARRYPQFNADIGTLDTKGGYLVLPVITKLILQLLKTKGVTILENVDITAITEKLAEVDITTTSKQYSARKLVITAGKGTNDIVNKIKSNRLVFPIAYERPQRKYYYPTADSIEAYMPENFPVFAYTDVGIYGHPIFDRNKGAVKVAYFVPVGMRKDAQTITCIEDFVDTCLPGLRNVRSEEIKDADTCWYDTVADDDFILGGMPGFNNIVVGTGWRGTGYKFAPLIGKILSQIALQKGTVYDINQFNPGRFRQ